MYSCIHVHIYTCIYLCIYIYGLTYLEENELAGQHFKTDGNANSWCLSFLICVLEKMVCCSEFSLVVRSKVY